MTSFGLQQTCKKTTGCGQLALSLILKESLRGGGAYYGEADILGKPYITGYQPIHDAVGAVVGIYYVGYPKIQ
ncbi:hypothetical protein PPGU19_091990 (plasmid) [Paraburkholderia sp. PGU19]|nr:hypothetical protein PPGU19_091990 [Paraburkholderia sp. PGU19]